MTAENTQAYIQKEMEKARQSLKAARNLLKEELEEDSISRAYYAVFHATRAVLRMKSIETKSHKGLISQFALHFVKPGLVEVEYGNILRQEKEDREIGDYETFSSFSSDEAKKRVEDAEKFVKRMKQLLEK